MITNYLSIYRQTLVSINMTIKDYPLGAILSKNDQAFSCFSIEGHILSWIKRFSALFS